MIEKLGIKPVLESLEARYERLDGADGTPDGTVTGLNPFIDLAQDVQASPQDRAAAQVMLALPELQQALQNATGRPAAGSFRMVDLRALKNDLATSKDARAEWDKRVGNVRVRIDQLPEKTPLLENALRIILRDWGQVQGPFGRGEHLIQEDGFHRAAEQLPPGELKNALKVFVDSKVFAAIDDWYARNQGQSTWKDGYIAWRDVAGFVEHFFQKT